MGQDFFTNLPAEMAMNILSRLPVVTTMSCKCVCKSWLHLLETPQFVKSHFSRSIPGLAVFQGNERPPYKVYEFAEYSEPHCNLAFKFSFPYLKLIHSSTDGLLLLLCDGDMRLTSHNLFICNPVTRDYINLPSPPVPLPKWEMYGFGVSKVSSLYKVIRICSFDDQLECQVAQVYTLGTGSWRSIAPSGLIKFSPHGNDKGAFLNGFFHLFGRESKAPRISCFDLETELVSSFSSPPSPKNYLGSYVSLSALRDCLCLCESTVDGTVIWLMNSYGDEKSWAKQLIIPRGALYMDYRISRCPIKVFKDGDILIALARGWRLACYSSKTRTMGDTVLVKSCGFHRLTSAVSYTPSLISLKTFAMEKVSSFGGEGRSEHHLKSMKRKRSE